MVTPGNKNCRNAVIARATYSPSAAAGRPAPKGRRLNSACLLAYFSFHSGQTVFRLLSVPGSQAQTQLGGLLLRVADRFFLNFFVTTDLFRQGQELTYGCAGRWSQASHSLFHESEIPAHQLSLLSPYGEVPERIEHSSAQKSERG